MIATLAKDTVVLPQSEDERFLHRQMMAWLWTLSFPVHCALVRLLLSHSGYSTVRACYAIREGRTASKEGGLDLVAFCHTDLATFVTAISIKTGRVSVSRRLADEMRGAMLRAGADQALLFATGQFSRRTRRVAGAAHLPPLRLVDGEELAALLIEHRLGVRRAPGTQEKWEFDPRFFERLERRVNRDHP